MPRSKAFTKYGYLPDGYVFIDTTPIVGGGNVAPGSVTDAMLANLINSGSLTGAAITAIIAAGALEIGYDTDGIPYLK